MTIARKSRLKVHAIACWLFIFFSPYSVAKPQLTITTWCPPPFSNAEQTGSFDLILKDAFASLGIKVNIIQKPAERSLQDANGGHTDGEFLRIADIDKIYPDLIRVPEALFNMEFVAFSKNKHLVLPNKWQSLTNHSLGYIIGWKIVEENISNVGYKVGISDQIKLFQLLDANRFEIALYSRVLGQQIINDLGIKGIHTSTPVAAQPMYLFLHKRHKNLISKLAIAIKESKKQSLDILVRTGAK